MLLLFCTTTLATAQTQVIDFEELAAGEIVNTVTADGGYSGIEVLGTHQSCPIPNAAVIFDSSCPGGCSGNDPDLGSPNETFGGAGEGAAGEAGSPFENNMPLGNILIVHSNCRDLNAGPVANPNDYGGTWTMQMNFPTPVTMQGFSVLDVETDEAMLVTLMDELGDTLQTVSVPATGDNGFAALTLPDPVARVSQVGIDRKGSGAIDNIVFNPATADLSIHKTARQEEIEVGGRTFFDIWLTNDGPDAATNIVIEDRWSAGQENSGYESPGTVTEIDGGLIIEVDSLAAGDSLYIQVFTDVTTEDSLHYNIVEVVAVDQDDPDSTPGNDDIEEDDQDIVYFRSFDLSGTADLRLWMEASNLTPSVQEEVTFRVTLANDGPADATGVIVVDTLQAGISFVNQSGTFDALDELGNVLGARVETLAAGDSVFWEIVVLVDSSGTIANAAEVFISEVPDPDSSPGNGNMSEDDFASVVLTTSGAAERRQVMLFKNYPNPFNPTTNIAFQLEEASHVELAVFDLLGRRVMTVVDGAYNAGAHEVRLDATHLPSGMYLYRIKTPNGVQTRRMSLLR